MEYVCEYCNKTFNSTKKSKFCSRNCRTKHTYHQKHLNARTYISNRTKEEKRETERERSRNRYKTDETYREYMKMKRKLYYEKRGK